MVSYRTTRLFAAASALALALVGEAHAQEAAKAAGQEPGMLSEVVVTAQRRAENIQNVPFTVAAVSAETLKQTTVRNLSDLSAITPGLTIVRAQIVNGGSSTITLRGFVQYDDVVGADQPVAMYVDNVFHEGLGGLAGLNMYDLDHVEVLKGPQGTLFGRNATGGAVQIFTRSAVLNKFNAELLAGAGNMGIRRAAGFVNLPLNEWAALRITGEWNRQDGWVKSVVNGQEQGGAKNKVIRGSLVMKPTSELSVTARAGYSKLDAENPPNKIIGFSPSSPVVLSTALELRGTTIAQGGLPTAAQIGAAIAALNAEVALPYDRNSAVNNNFQTVEQTYASLEAGYDLSENVSLKSITGYRHLTSHSETDTDGTRFILIRSPQHRRLNEFSQELQVSVRAFDDRLKAIGGAYYYRLKAADDQYSQALAYLTGLTASTTRPDLTRVAPALFGQATFDVTPKISVTGGLRYTWDKQKMTQRGTLYSDATFTTPIGCTVPDSTLPCAVSGKTKDKALSWLATVQYRPMDGVMLYGRAARGFKSGGNQPRPTANPSTITPYKPEFLTEYEVGVRSEWFNRRLRVNADVYQDRFEDAQRIVVAFAPGAGFATTIQNVAQAKITGFEADVSAVLLDGLTVGGTFGYTDAKFTRYPIQTFAPPPAPAVIDVAGAYAISGTPKWQYTLHGAYEHPTAFGSVVAALDWRWVDKAYANPNGIRGPESFPSNIDQTLFPPGVSDSLQRQRAYGLLGGRLTAKFEKADLEIALWGKNLLDKHYYPFRFDLIRAGLGSVEVVAGEPRTWGVEVRKGF